MGLWERLGRKFAPSAPTRSDAGLAVVTPNAKFLNENRGTILTGMQATLRNANADVRAAWQRAAAHAVDVIQNSGFIAGMVDQYANEVVGKGLRLQLSPNHTSLGMTEEGAWLWASDIESRFHTWALRAHNCDAEDRSNFYKFQRAQAKAHVAFGETFTHIAWQKRYGTVHGTKFKGIPAYAVANKDNGSDVVMGVHINEAGAPKGYWFRKRAETGMGQIEETYVAKRDRFGRSQIVHTMDADIGQYRGITPLAPALQVVRQFDRLQDATLTAATLQTVFAATIKSELPSADILNILTVPGEADHSKSVLENWLDVTEAYGKHVDIDLGRHGKIPHLLPNEELDLKTASHPGTQYVDFAKFLLHEIARCLGLTFESATGDYSNATYASLNIGETKNYALFSERRQNLVAPMCDEIFMAWLEEDIQIGATRFPGGVQGFLSDRYSAFTTSWRGPGKPQADDLKAAKAWQTLDNMGVISHSAIAAERGEDIEDVYQQRSRERQRRKALGLPEPVEQRTPDVADQQLMEGQ